MRLAVVGAFPYPLAQGSQVFAAGQVRALCAAGAEAVLLSYGRGQDPGDAETQVARRAIPRWLSPRALRSGPNLGKPLADVALAALLVREARRTPFDGVLAHNVEGALVALATQGLHGAPVVYVAHTLMGVELSSYLPRARVLAERVGATLDGAVARRADAVVALSQPAADALRDRVGGELVTIPPGHHFEPPVGPDQRRRACRAAGVEEGRFVLYAGNLDAYQDLEILDAVAARLAAAGVPVLAATHDARGAGRLPRLRVHPTRDVQEVRALCAAAGALALPRRRAPGFPIKLLNYLESGRPVVASVGSAHGLVHDRHAWLLPESASPQTWSDAFRALLARPGRARKLGEAGRRWLEHEHDWARRARETLELMEGVRTRGPARLGARGRPACSAHGP